jgi:hypothetical protein
MGSKEVLDGIYKIRRRFLWAGDKALSGAKCKVNRIRPTLPKEYGGLGVLDLNKFATTPRIRWHRQDQKTFPLGRGQSALGGVGYDPNS